MTQFNGGIMKFCFLLLFISLICSCKKSQDVNSGFTRNIKLFEAKSFYTFNFEDQQSILRRKLLNQMVSTQLNFESVKIKTGDEFLFEKNEMNLSQRDLELYKDREKTHLKVIVSYSNQEEIFFLPAGIPLKEGIESLKLKDTHQIFRILNGESQITIAGQTVYAIFFSKEELVKNDQYFYEKTVTGSQNIVNKKWQINLGQKLIFKLKTSYFSENVVVKEFEGRQRSCKMDVIEAGMCFCNFKRVVSDLAMKPIALPDQNLLGIQFKIDGEAQDFKVENSELNFEFNFTANDSKNIVFVELIHNENLQRAFRSEAYDYQGNCLASPGTSETVRSQSKIEGELVIKGRGEDLLHQLRF